MHRSASRPRLRIALPTFAVLVLLALPAAAQASWLGNIVGATERAAPPAARPATGAIDNAAAYVRSLPAKADGVALAAQATQEGHWRFVNRAGETFTAGTPEEMKRAAGVLAPDAAAGARVALYLTEDTVFVHRAALRDLPKGTELHLVAGGQSYRILRHGEGAAERLFAEVRPSLVVELADPKRFREAIWQLTRPINKARVRILALEPGGPPRLASTPGLDPATGRPLVDAVDPASLPAALGTVGGQTVLIAGRVDGRLLYVQPETGPERSVLLPDLVKAAEDADVNLLVLRAATTPRQPGGRNWLWQKVQVKGLEQAMQHASFADFLNALAAPGDRFLVSATPAGRRTSLQVSSVADLGAAPSQRPAGGLFSGVVAELTGRVVTVGLDGSLRSAERQRELDWRLLPGIPSNLQAGYLVLVLLGLVGVPVARTWWQRLWPPETAADYEGRTGYWAARIVRGAAFLLLFLPLTAPVAAPLSLWRQARDAATAPLRWWRRLTGRSPAPGRPVAQE